MRPDSGRSASRFDAVRLNLGLDVPEARGAAEPPGEGQQQAGDGGLEQRARKEGQEALVEGGGQVERGHRGEPAQANLQIQDKPG